MVGDWSLHCCLLVFGWGLWWVCSWWVISRFCYGLFCCGVEVAKFMDAAFAGCCLWLCVGELRVVIVLCMLIALIWVFVLLCCALFCVVRVSFLLVVYVVWAVFGLTWFAVSYGFD